MSVGENFNRSQWTKDQDKSFENSLAMYGGEPNNRWEIIAAALTGKTRQEIKHHYELLIEDVSAIESGSVPLPNYANSGAEDIKNEHDSAVKQSGSTRARKGSRGEKERKKGIAWTEEEHREFLKGLDRFGRGDWRSISRHCVQSRTPTQVASHAQKYYNRMNSGTKQRKRNSIHDVKCEDEGQTSAPQGQAGEMTGASASGTSAITEKSPPPISPPVLMNDVDMSDPFEYMITGNMNELSAAPQGLVGEYTGASASGASAITEKSPPSIPPPVLVNDGDTSNPFGYMITGNVNEFSAPQGPAGEMTGASASGISTITEKSPPPIPPPVLVNDVDMSDPFEYMITGNMNEFAAPQGPVGGNTGAYASQSSAITDISPPIPPHVLVNDGDTSDPFGYITGNMNEFSAAGPFSVAGMSSPYVDFSIMGPPSPPTLPSPTQTIYGFDAPLLDEYSLFDISDVPFF